MLTLGIHDGHTATAALFADGRIVAAISEERLNRQKEWSGFPEMAIRECLRITGKSPEQVDAVGVCSLMPQIGSESYMKPLWHKRLFAQASHVLPARILQSRRCIEPIRKISRILFRHRQAAICERLVEMGIRTDRVDFFEHHLLHAATALYTSWHREKERLAVTLDGSGDAVCATINAFRENRIVRLTDVFNYNSICDFYTRVTQYLGMKPMSHEYKVMGMAPYASEKGKTGVMKRFSRYYAISPRDPLQFLNTSGRWKWQFMEEFRDTLMGERFDWIAGAAQDLFEEVVGRWVENALKETGIGHLVLSGGGFMNVKLNYRISRLPQVRSLFVFPSCGDESNPVGAAILSALNAGFSADDVEPLGMVDWGTSFSDEQVDVAIQRMLQGKGLNISRPERIDEAVAKKVAEGKITGRLHGRMEWGARALGNRSILADPRNPKIIHRINRAIKMRDFWMPFAPAILDTYRSRYLILRDDFRSPFMTIAPDTHPEAWEHIPAGLHPFDHSARAQILEERMHSSFYRIVTHFEKMTGVGGVLNTSFNLHGDPIVCSPEDAIDTFLRSELDALQLEGFLVEK